jgi:hypothetical protein
MDKMEAIEVKHKTLEDLTMLVVKKNNPTLYNNRILPIYNKVEEIARFQLEIESKETITYATSYVFDLNADSQDMIHLIADF